jgi:hypothetical protein
MEEAIFLPLTGMGSRKSPGGNEQILKVWMTFCSMAWPKKKTEIMALNSIANQQWTCSPQQKCTFSRDYSLNMPMF